MHTNEAQTVLGIREPVQDSIIPILHDELQATDYFEAILCHHISASISDSVSAEPIYLRHCTAAIDSAVLSTLAESCIRLESLTLYEMIVEYHAMKKFIHSRPEVTLIISDSTGKNNSFYCSVARHKHILVLYDAYSDRMERDCVRSLQRAQY